MIYRLVVSYRGAAYGGWQRQANARTVQGVLEEAVGDLARAAGWVAEDDPAPVVVGASRTDAGVHARGQAAHVELPAPGQAGALVHAVNHRLPDDVRVMDAAEMPPGFHARKHAGGKEYSYRLSRARVISPLDAPFAARVPPGVDVGRLAAAAALVPGRHDFSAFALAGGSHGQPFRRVFDAAWEEAGAELRFRITGDGFLRGMVRALVGTLVEVGLGRRSIETFAALLEGGSRASAGATAPAHGLVLERVDYPPAWRGGGGGAESLDMVP